MSERLKEFYKKIHNPKNNVPIYATILVRSARKLLDFKIRKEPENILRVIAHDQKKTGWFIHSFHIPIKNLGLSPDSKDKEILAHLSDPSKVPNKTTREFVEDILRKYINILPEKKRYYFKTERFKKKKEFQTGVKLKGF
ncbi:MAG: hypothetical protein ACFFDX_00105 [Candidatus Odinarchaeota archaeon]